MAVDKKRKSAVMIDVGIPSDSNVRKKVHEKPAPTQTLSYCKSEIRICKLRRIKKCLSIGFSKYELPRV